VRRFVAFSPRVARDCVAAVAAPLAVAGAAELWPALPAVWRWVALLAAVLLASWRRGLRAALVSLGVAALLATCLWLPPRYSLRIEAPEHRLALLLFSGLTASLLLLEVCVPDGPINDAPDRRARRRAGHQGRQPSEAVETPGDDRRSDWVAWIIRFAVCAALAAAFGWLAFGMAVKGGVEGPAAFVLGAAGALFGLIAERVLRDPGADDEGGPRP
jgi:hypothetical protein